MKICLRSRVALESVVCLSVLTLTVPLYSQTVSCEGGNVIYNDKRGRVVQITSLGLDSDPGLSKDGRQVVFVRRTPSLEIDTGLGDTEDNELWIGDASGERKPKRVLVGHSGGFAVDENLVLAGFSRPQFSPDGERVYFIAQAWATASSIRLLDLKSNQVRFVAVGLSLEVLQSGQYAGYLIARKAIPLAWGGRTWRYWLLDPEGKEVGEIGDKESAAEEFKKEHAVQN